FLGESDADTALARLQRDPTDLGQLRPTLPIGLVNLIHRTLARNPAHRPQTGSDLRTALLAVDTTPPHVDKTPAEPPERLVNRPVRPLPATPAIPGEPHVSGLVPTQAPAERPRPRRADTTPPVPAPIRGRPARRDQQRRTPSLLVVGGLLLVAAVVAGVLYVVLNRGDEPDDVPPTTVVPEAAPAGEATAAGAADPEDPEAVA